jgi:uncharacterized protein YjiS (DUF1127 family)
MVLDMIVPRLVKGTYDEQREERRLAREWKAANAERKEKFAVKDLARDTAEELDDIGVDVQGPVQKEHESDEAFKARREAAGRTLDLVMQAAHTSLTYQQLADDGARKDVARGLVEYAYDVAGKDLTRAQLQHNVRVRVEAITLVRDLRKRGVVSDEDMSALASFAYSKLNRALYKENDERSQKEVDQTLSDALDDLREALPDKIQQLKDRRQDKEEDKRERKAGFILQPRNAQPSMTP